MDLTSSLHAQPDGTLLVLVTNPETGRNRIIAFAGRRFASLLEVIDRSINGPVFSGKQQLPFLCQTTSFGLAPASPPTALHGQAPSPLRPDSNWNGKLIHTFGGGCNSGYHQGTSTGGVLNDQVLSNGYAVASSTLNVLDNNCSTIISAEAAMMVKEHIIDTYGPVRFTIGWAGSGGAIQQYEIADSYPGILDGIIPSISFPDPLTTAGPVTRGRSARRAAH
jgi:hypothetical protein